MYRILWNGQSAMNANQNRLDIISNNIANMSTNGYKRLDVSFKDLMSETLEKKGYPTNDKGAFTGTGVKSTEAARDQSQSVLLATGTTTDFGIDGEGLFKVIGENGETFYTRDGSFTVDVNGDIVNSNGDRLAVELKPGYENHKFNARNLFIDKNGNISVKNEEGKFNEIGRIPLYSAIGDDSFTSVGRNMFKANVPVFEVKNSNIYQGTVEGSNVDIGEEFSDMIMTQRAFQLGSKSINIADEMWGMVNDIKR
ncbi:MAG: flagellar hook-basal body complex protein [Sarcina sp.]